MTEKNYIAEMRALVGHQGMIFVTAFGVLWSADRTEILLERRADSPDSGWGFPGGFLDYGESPMQAVVREFKEETGLDVEVVRVLGFPHISSIKMLGAMRKKISPLVLKYSSWADRFRPMAMRPLKSSGSPSHPNLKCLSPKPNEPCTRF